MKRNDNRFKVVSSMKLTTILESQLLCERSGCISNGALLHDPRFANFIRPTLPDCYAGMMKRGKEEWDF